MYVTHSPPIITLSFKLRFLANCLSFFPSGPSPIIFKIGLPSNSGNILIKSSIFFSLGETTILKLNKII